MDTLNLTVTKFLSLILNLTFLTLIECNFKYNISLSEMETCKTYLVPATRGYVYTDFFYIHNLDNNKLASNELLHLKFYVMTARDAHILLSVTDHPRLQDRVYEIVIGAGRNKFSTIRTNIGRRRVATDMEANILSMLDPVPIEIIQTKDGNLLVLVPGLKEDPLMNYSDIAPLNINYVSFTTYENEPARWFYDCRFDGFDTEIVAETRPLNSRQRLLLDVINKVDNSTPPIQLRSINFGFQISAVEYNSEKAVMTIRLNINLSWNDPRLTWNISNYSNIEILSYTGTNIWLPDLLVMNAAMQTHQFLMDHYELYVKYDGNITMAISDVEVNTWCLNIMENWPNEKLTCEMALGVITTMATHHEQGIQLTFDASNPLSKQSISTHTDWSLKQISITAIENGEWARYRYDGIVQTMPNDISILFQIVRNSKFYGHIFITPLLVCQILLMLSFFLKNHYCTAVILVAYLVGILGILFITKVAPTAYVPNLLYAYQCLIHASVFCYMMHVLLIWMESYPLNFKPHNCLMKILNYTPLNFILCLKLIDTNNYVDHEKQPWLKFSKMLNALSFYLINIIFIFADVLLLPLS